MTSNLSGADRKNLTPHQQNQIANYKHQWQVAQAAGNTSGMEAAHAAAEAIRSEAGYSGGADGSGYIKLPATSGEQSTSARDVQGWVDEYRRLNLDADNGWTNGYDVNMNLRSMANYIRQQMQANSDAWADADEAGKAYLHDQNLQLAQILSDAAGGVQSRFNEELGRWETDNANLGYGYYTGGYLDPEWEKEHYGMTDEQIEAYRNDTDRYHNFVDQSVIRNWVDESSGYTGIYSQFVNGPYGQLLMGTKNVNPQTYTDLIGDGFGDDGRVYDFALSPDGKTVQPMAPLLKNNNTMTDYTRGANGERVSHVVDGVIHPGTLTLAHPGGGKRQKKDSEEEDRRRVGDPVGEKSADTLLNNWQRSELAQAGASYDYAVDKAVQELLAAKEKADRAYREQRNQITRDELHDLDNAALYAEARGDRGGIGMSQYNHIQAQADANRQAVSTAQVQMAADTARQIAQLRADGQFRKADEMMEISQAYLLKLLEMEKWAAQTGLSTDQFEDILRKWRQDYRLSLSGSMI